MFSLQIFRFQLGATRLSRRRDRTRVFLWAGSETLWQRVVDCIANRMDVPADEIPHNFQLFDATGADSLDKVELLMELEEELDFING